MSQQVSRRTVIGCAVGLGTVAVGVAAGYGLVAATGAGDAPAAPGYAPPPGPDPTVPTVPPTAVPDTAVPDTAGTEVTTVDAIPDGGGAVFAQSELVLVRSGTDVHGFSARCTHAGCLVDSVSDGQIHCPCHGSAFAISDGAPVAGPAPAPLPAVAVTVKDGKVFLPSRPHRPKIRSRPNLRSRRPAGGSRASRGPRRRASRVR